MVVMNATLAGGVAIGSASSLVVSPSSAMIVGAFAGILSAIGFLKLSRFLEKRVGLHDTCGVNNLHGLPGILGGVIGAASTSVAEYSFSTDEELAETNLPCQLAVILVSLVFENRDAVKSVVTTHESHNAIRCRDEIL